MPGIGLNPGGCCCGSPAPLECGCFDSSSPLPTTLHVTFSGLGGTFTVALTHAPEIGTCAWKAACADYGAFGKFFVFLYMPPIFTAPVLQIGYADNQCNSTGSGCSNGGAPEVVCSPLNMKFNQFPCLPGISTATVTL